jgi:hypothetical protein
MVLMMDIQIRTYYDNRSKKKQKPPIIFNGEDIIHAIPHYDYYGRLKNFELILRDKENRKFGLRVPIEFVGKLILKHFKSRKTIPAIPKSKYAYVEG